MKQTFKTMKPDFLLSSLFCILMGVILIIGKADVIRLIGTLFSVLLIVIGVFYIGGVFLNLITGGISTVVGVILLILGVWCLLNPTLLVSMIPVAIGIVITLHGLRSLMTAITSRKFGNSAWLINLLLSIVSIAFGLFCIFKAVGILENIVAFLGVALIFNGVSNLWVIFTGANAERRYNREHNIIDVDCKEE